MSILRRLSALITAASLVLSFMCIAPAAAFTSEIALGDSTVLPEKTVPLERAAQNIDESGSLLEASPASGSYPFEGTYAQGSQAACLTFSVTNLSGNVRQNVSFNFVGSSANLFAVRKAGTSSASLFSLWVSANQTVDLELYLRANAQAGNHSVQLILEDTLDDTVLATYDVTLRAEAQLLPQEPPTGLEALPAPSLYENGALKGTTSAMEYRLLNTEDYLPCQDGQTLVAPGNYQIRMAATDEAAPSEPVEITVGISVLTVAPSPGNTLLENSFYLNPEPSKLVVEITNETPHDITYSAVLEDSPAFSVFSSVRPMMGSGSVALGNLPPAHVAAVTVQLLPNTPASPSPYKGTLTIQIGDEPYVYTFSQAVEQASQADAPAGLTGLSPSLAQTSGGAIEGTSAHMEYTSLGRANFHPCTAGATPVENPGVYQVRFSGSDNVLPSPAAFITVPEDETYTVQYDANGGQGTIVPVSQPVGQRITLSDGTGFSREGYSFTGWRTRAGLGQGTFYGADTAFSHSVSETVFLYAQWQANPAPPDPPDPVDPVDPVGPTQPGDPDPSVPEPVAVAKPSSSQGTSIASPLDSAQPKTEDAVFVSPDDTQLPLTRGSTEAGLGALSQLYSANREGQVTVNTADVVYSFPPGSLSANAGLLHDFGAVLYDTESVEAKAALSQTDTPDAVVVRLLSETLPVTAPIEVTYDLGSWFRKKTLRVYRLNAHGKLELLAEIQADDSGIATLWQQTGGAFLFVPLLEGQV